MREENYWGDKSDHDQLFLLIGEYVVTFNYLVHIIELVLEEWMNPLKKWGSKVSGTFIGSRNKKADLDSLLSIFKAEGDKLILESMHIKNEKTKREAVRELKQILKELEFENRARNFIVHGNYTEWSPSHPYVSKSEPVNFQENKNFKINNRYGNSTLHLSTHEFREDIEALEKLASRIFDFFQKYQYGDGLESRKFSIKRKKQLEDFEKKSKPFSQRDLKNLNFATIISLDRLGISDRNDLKTFGPEKVYALLLRNGYPASKRLLRSLIGASEGRDWRKVSTK